MSKTSAPPAIAATEHVTPISAEAEILPDGFRTRFHRVPRLKIAINNQRKRKKQQSVNANHHDNKNEVKNKTARQQCEHFILTEP